MGIIILANVIALGGLFAGLYLLIALWKKLAEVAQDVEEKE
jgi:hypothetical protein